MKISEIRNLSKEDINLKIVSLKEEMGKLNYQRRAGRVDKPHLFKKHKKTIAQMMTVLKEMDSAKKE